ncbi:MAG: chorismate synthase [Oscillospiraceae bacterium]|nr:chorismate synthase [Oscillospiraceae bacterium]
MKNSFGSSVSVTLFGESHGGAVGAVLDGLAPGLPVDRERIARQLALRRPQGNISTARVEEDRFEIVSGVFEGRTTGTPLCLLIPNENTRSRDYAATRALARPGHADYTAYIKYHGYEDYRGGGHFSGRVTAALVAAGAVAIGALRNRGIAIGTHIARCAGVPDRAFSEDALGEELELLNALPFAVLDAAAGERMREAIAAAAAEGDSVGGVLETAVLGLPAGVGEPWFDTLEGLLAHGLFSIPGIKGVQFGAGFDLAEARGSAFNDAFYAEGGAIKTRTNRNGGINGGISNGMPILFRCAVKPTPSIFRPQETVNFQTGENTVLALKGRHDPAIIHRARVVVDSVAAIALCDALAQRWGTDWIGGGTCAADC